MTMTQVNQTIGCNYDPTQTAATTSFVSNTWYYLNPTTFAAEEITVYFDPTDSVVTPPGGVGNNIKLRVGF